MIRPAVLAELGDAMWRTILQWFLNRLEGK
jgi:hypothetical protein